MLPVMLARLLAGVAIGGAALWWLSRRGSTGEKTSSDIRARQHPAPVWLSDYRMRRDPRRHDNALVDAAVEDSFPASDPPSFMQSVVVGPPSHEDEADEHSDRRVERVMESSGAGPEEQPQKALSSV